MDDDRYGRGGPREASAREYSWERRPPPQHQRVYFVLLVVTLAISGLAFYHFTGPPRLPVPLGALPWHAVSWHALREFLFGPPPPLDPSDVLPWVLAVFWAFWAWCVWTIGVEIVFSVAEWITRGAAWVRSLRAAFERVTIPQVRRLANGAVVATTLVQLASRPSGAEASGYQPEAVAALVAVPTPDPAADAARQDAARQADEAPVLKYTVQPDDNLWAIAERFYGSGWDYERILTANEDRQMPDGRWFGHRSSVIHPGWVLDIPYPEVRLEQREGRTEYLIQPSETLGGIASRLFGDELRWPELVRANRSGVDHDRLLWAGVSSRADQLWPSMRIAVPDSVLHEAAGGAIGLTGGRANAGTSDAVTDAAPCTVISIVAPAADGAVTAAASGARGSTQEAPLSAADAPVAPEAARGAQGDVADTAQAAGAGLAATPWRALPSPVAALAGAAFVSGAISGGTAVAAARRLRRSLAESPVRLRSALRRSDPSGPSYRLVRAIVPSADPAAGPAAPATGTPLRAFPPIEIVVPDPVAAPASLWDQAAEPHDPHAPREPAPPVEAAGAIGAAAKPPAAATGTATGKTERDQQGNGTASSPVTAHDETAVAEAAAGTPAPTRPAVPPAPAVRAGAGAPIWIQCLGHLRVTARGDAGDVELSEQVNGTAHHKPWAILAYLASQPGGAAPADRIIEAFWDGETDPKDPNRVLRVSLARLRELIRAQVPGLPADTEIVCSERDGTRRLDSRYVASDVVRFTELCEAAEKRPPPEALRLYEEAFHLYRGDLLTDSPYTWIHERVFDGDGLTPRERLREAYKRVVCRLAALYFQSGRFDETVAIYEGLLRAEPTLEDVARELYRCYEQMGDLPSLLRTHARLRKALRDNFGTDETADAAAWAPQPETERVFRQVEERLRKAAPAQDLTWQERQAA